MAEEQIEVGRIEIKDGTYIRASVSEWKGNLYADLREYVESEKFTGPTKKGIRFHAENWAKFMDLVKQLDAEVRKRY
jgi:hypothetical protein